MRTKKNNQLGKAPIAMRYKVLEDGRKSIYLDTCQNGKRHYEFLKLYLLPEATKKDKTENAKTMREANSILQKRIDEFYNSKVEIPSDDSPSHMLLQDWFVKCRQYQIQRGVRKTDRVVDLAHIMAKFNPDARLDEVDKQFCIDFINYLRTVHKTKEGKNLSPSTVYTHSGSFQMALNEAVRQGVIAENPWSKLDRVEKAKEPESKREYLTIDEVKKLTGTPFYHEYVRQAFLFSCFCGIRAIDLEQLRWKYIFQDQGQWRLGIVQQKTGEVLYSPLSQQAVKWLPERGEDDALVFPKVSDRLKLGDYLKIWMAAAGIKKKITFHCARHTFATMMLTIGADIYTTSKLMGHTSIRSTQIYAKIVDEAKDKAVNLADNISWT